MKQLATAFLTFFTVIALFSCDDNSLEEQRNKELELLNEYLLENYPDVEPTSSGLYYIEETDGTGDTIKIGDRVQIYYATWRLSDSLLIDESNGYTSGFRYEPLEFVVGTGSVIAGLDEAMTYMQKGTVANLVIDSGLAYGQNGSGSVPGFTSLLMQVEVYKVYPAN
jgi:FKBP-type peptidyl-prolyl cis-trans isomerase